MNTETNNFLEHLRKHIRDGAISYKEYIGLCLYHPQFGYYSKNKTRVGRSKDSDFYTAESLGSVFSKLVVESIQSLIKKSELSADLSDYTFIEIGTEPEYALTQFLEKNPFKRTHVLRLGEALKIEESLTILFANEWLDALPFHRIIFKDEKWRERGVQFNAQGTLEETLLNQLSSEIKPLETQLSQNTTEGYQIDLSLEAANQVSQLISHPWKGIGLFFDYGKMWKELLFERPGGSARTYHQHTQDSDLLKNPSESDITCDICWDFILERLDQDPNVQSKIDSQESFFVQNAGNAIETIITESAFTFSKEKQTVMELIHPSHMGKKFQVLHFIRN